MLYVEQHLKEPFAQHLDRNERIVWAGQPRQGIFLSKIDVFLIPFSLVWCGVVAFWMINAAEASIFFALFGVPFALIGLFLLIGRFFLDSRNRRQTYYALTNKRALIKTVGKRKIFRAIDLHSELETRLEMETKNPNQGSILFLDPGLFDRKKEEKSYATAALSSSRFFLITNASKVYEEMKEIASSQPTSETSI